MTGTAEPRVMVTRPETADGPLCRALRSAGCDPVVAPGFTYCSVDTVPDQSELDGFAWVVWTSAAAVEAVQPRHCEETLHAAVGGATSQALADHGIEAALVGDGGASELAELLLERLEPGTRILYPRSAKADRSFAERLRTFGIDVDDRVVYDVEPADPAPLRAAMAAGVEAITFASPSAVKGFAEAVGEEFSVAGDGVLVASIGPTTTGACRSHLREPDVLAPEPTFGALAEAVATAVAERRERTRVGDEVEGEAL